MKRPIVPIKIFNMIIVTYDDLQQLYKNDLRSYSILYYNGDCKKISFSYSSDLPCVNGNVMSLNEIGYTDNSIDPTRCKDSCLLLAKKYITKNPTIQERLSIVGFHKHRTSLDANESTIKIKHELDIKDILLRNIRFELHDGARISIESSMLDNVEITLLGGAEIRLDDVEFSNNIRACIVFRKGSKITKNKNVRFFDVFRRFYIEKAVELEVGLLFDFFDGNSIINFLRTSTIREICLLGNIESNIKDVRINQDIVFTNSTQEIIKIEFQRVMIESDFLVGQNIILNAKIEVVEVDDVKISLATFYGIMNIKDSSDIRISASIFENRAQGILTFDGSIVNIDHCKFKDLEEPIQFSNSQIRMRNCQIDKVYELLKKVDFDTVEEEFLIQKNEIPSIIELTSSSITATKLLAIKDIQQITFKNLEIQNIAIFADLRNIKNIDVNDIQGADVDTFLHVRNSFAKIKDVSIANGCKLLIMETSTIELTRLVAVNFEAGVEVHSAVLKIYASLFERCNVGINLADENAKLFHSGCNFDGCLERKIALVSGATIVDIDESEENRLLCQTS